MTHKGRCFRDRRRTKRRKLKQRLLSLFDSIVPPKEVHIPEVATIPLPIIQTETPLSEAYKPKPAPPPTVPLPPPPPPPQPVAPPKRRSW